MINSSDVEIYNEIFRVVQSLDIPVYDYKPAIQKTMTPFVTISGIRSMYNDSYNKTKAFEDLDVEVDVWGKRVDRTKVSNAIENIITKVAQIEETSSFKIANLEQNTIKNLIMDNTTPETIWHGVISFNFKILGGK